MLIVLVLVVISRFQIGETLKQGYVYGGSYPKLQTFPHSAFLSVSCLKNEVDNLRGEWLCGASIVHKGAVLSAAHCMDGCLMTRVIAATGNSPDRRFSYPAKKFHIHEEYNVRTMHNDIAIIQLNNAIQFNDVVKPVKLVSRLPYRVEEGYLAGWGHVNITERRSGTAMRHTRVEIYSGPICTQLLHGVPPGTFCAGNNYVNFEFASTESGSALVKSEMPKVHQNASEYIQLGLVSYSMPRVTEAVNVYTDVSFFYKWINETVKKVDNYFKTKESNAKLKKKLSKRG